MNAAVASAGLCSSSIVVSRKTAESQVLGAGCFARVDPPTVRSLRNVSDSEDAVYVCVGGADGYVGRDGVVPD